MLFFLKMFTVLAVGVTAVLLYDIYAFGRRLTTTPSRVILWAHRRSVWRVALCTLGIVALAEMCVQMSSNPRFLPWLLYFHWIAVAVLLVLFGMILWRFNGCRNPRMHRRLVYPLFGMYGTVTISGLVLLWLLPP